MLNFIGHGLGEILVALQHVQSVEPSFPGWLSIVKEQDIGSDGRIRSKDAMRHSYDCVQIKLTHQFFLILYFALSVPKRKPSGRITAARPFFLSLYIITFINRSAVSELLSSVGKFTFTLSFSFPSYGGFIKTTSRIHLTHIFIVYLQGITMKDVWIINIMNQHIGYTKYVGE